MCRFKIRAIFLLWYQIKLSTNPIDKALVVVLAGGSERTLLASGNIRHNIIYYRTTNMFVLLLLLIIILDLPNLYKTIRIRVVLRLMT